MSEMVEGLTDGQKEHLNSRYGLIDGFSNKILTHAVEVGLLSLRREYEIERNLEEPIEVTPKKKELIDQVISDYQAGMTIIEIGVKHKKAHSSIYYMLKRAGVKTRKRSKKS